MTGIIGKLTTVKNATRDFKNSLWSVTQTQDMVPVVNHLIDARVHIEDMIDLDMIEPEVAINSYKLALNSLSRAQCDPAVRLMIVGHCHYQISVLEKVKG